MAIAPLRTAERALAALTLLLLVSPAAHAVRLDAVADTWIREQTPQTPYDNDLISVWATVLLETWDATISVVRARRSAWFSFSVMFWSASVVMAEVMVIRFLFG